MEPDDYLSDEEIARIWNHKYIDVYRIYYNSENGDIKAISNEYLDIEAESVEIDFQKIERFITGRDNFVFYRIEFDEEDAIKFVHKKESPVLFKSNIIEYIRVVEHNTAILQVEWHSDKWVFKVNPEFLKNPRSKSINSKINFFITRENNINVLYRIIEIQIKNLIESVEIPFTTDEEKDIKNIAMFTLPFFESYGMTVYED